MLNGRYGPYVNWGKVNANIPKDSKPEEVTIDMAVSLLAERAAKGPSAKKARGGKAKAEEKPAKKAAPKGKKAAAKAAESDGAE